MKENKWLLVVRQEKADAFKALYTAFSFIFLISIVGGAVIIAVAFYLTDHIIKRMLKKISLTNSSFGQAYLSCVKIYSNKYTFILNHPE